MMRKRSVSLPLRQLAEVDLTRSRLVKQPPVNTQESQHGQSPCDVGTSSVWCPQHLDSMSSRFRYMLLRLQTVACRLKTKSTTQNPIGGKARSGHHSSEKKANAGKHSNR